MKYRKLWIDGKTVLEVRAGRLYAMKESGVPVGLEFRAAGNGWAMLELVPWSDVPADERAEALS